MRGVGEGIRLPRGSGNCGSVAGDGGGITIGCVSKFLLRNGYRRGQRRLGLEGLERRHFLAASPIITEFMADNGGPPGLADGSVPPSYEDWVEIYNDGDAAIDLGGWHLTDNAANPGKWEFPSRTLP